MCKFGFFFALTSHGLRATGVSVFRGRGLKLNLDGETIDSDSFTHDLLSALIFMFMLVFDRHADPLLHDRVICFDRRAEGETTIFVRDLHIHVQGSVAASQQTHQQPRQCTKSAEF